jgi:hypothetical protein
VLAAGFAGAGCTHMCLDMGFAESGHVQIEIPVPPGTAASTIRICVEDLCGTNGATGEALGVSTFDGRYTAVVPPGSKVLRTKRVRVRLTIDGQDADVLAAPVTERPNGAGCEPALRVVRLAYRPAINVLEPVTP